MAYTYHKFFKNSNVKLLIFYQKVICNLLLKLAFLAKDWKGTTIHTQLLASWGSNKNGTHCTSIHSPPPPFRKSGFQRFSLAAHTRFGACFFLSFLHTPQRQSDTSTQTAIFTLLNNKKPKRKLGKSQPIRPNIKCRSYISIQKNKATR